MENFTVRLAARLASRTDCAAAHPRRACRAADVGDHKGCYEAYLAAGREICARTGDDQIRSIMEKAIADVEVQDNPTEQVCSILGHGGAGTRARARS